MTMSDRRSTGGRPRLALVAAAATLLATAPMAVVFAHWTWLWHCALAVGAVVAGATVARARSAPVWGQALAMAGALLLALTWLHPGGGALLVLPGPGTLAHFESLLTDAPQLVAHQVIPVDDHDSLLFVTALGIGLAAIMVDLATVAARRPALAGLPMLAIYSVPVAVAPESVHGVTFAVGAAGYLWLLVTDQQGRMERFGHRFTGSGRRVAAWEPSPLAAAGRRLALGAVALAVVLPWAVPSVGSDMTERFDLGSGGSGGGSGSASGSVNLFAHLDGLLNRDTTEELLRVDTDDPEPPYLRVGVASEISDEGFDPRTPRGGPLAERAPARTFLNGVSYSAHSAEIEVEDWQMDRLPVYPNFDTLTGVDQETWSYDAVQEVVFSEGTSASGAEYTLAYTRPEYDPQVLRQFTPQPGEVPEDLTETVPNPRVDSLVARLTRDEDNAYDRVRALLAHFSRDNGFRYSLETGPATSGSAIEDFLFENQAGYCVQYAAALAWMVRSAGLPSRVAIGFTRGEADSDGSYTLTNHNLHAWTEVRFGEFGWLPFDATPTSAVTGAASPEWAPDPDAGGEETEAPSPELEVSPGESSATPPPTEGPEFAPEPGTAAGTSAGDRGDGTATTVLAVVAALAVVLAALAAPAALRARVRRRRAAAARPPVEAAGAAGQPGVVIGDGSAAARHAAHAAWAELCDTLVDLALPVRQAATPRAVTRAVREQHATGARTGAHGGGGSVASNRASDGAAGAAADGALATALHTLAGAEERARYAPAASPVTDLHRALHTAVQVLTARAPARRRWQARLLPRSVLYRWRASATDLALAVASAGNRLSEVLTAWSPRRWVRAGLARTRAGGVR